MATMNVGGAITPAIKHTGRVLFRPFALRKWLALGFVSMLAELGQGGARFNSPGDMGDMDKIGRDLFQWIYHYIALIIAGVVLLFAIGLALSWLGAVMRFVYLNQITRDPCAIREPFGRFMHLGTSFFLWKLAFGLITMLALAVLIGLPIGLVFVTKATGNTAAIVLLVIWCVLVGLALLLGITVIDIFARDFVATAMFARSVRVIEGWRIVMPILRQNAGQSALYVLLLIAISFATGIAALFALLAVGMVFLIAGGLFALIGYGIYAAGGSTWSAVLIGYIALMGTALFLAFCYAMSCVTQPFDVFRRTFALVVLGQAEPSLATVPVGPSMQDA